MNSSQAATITALILAFAVTSCSNTKKDEKEATAGILGQLSAEPILSEEQVDRLK